MLKQSLVGFGLILGLSACAVQVPNTVPTQGTANIQIFTSSPAQSAAPTATPVPQDKPVAYPTTAPSVAPTTSPTTIITSPTPTASLFAVSSVNITIPSDIGGHVYPSQRDFVVVFTSPANNVHQKVWETNTGKVMTDYYYNQSFMRPGQTSFALGTANGLNPGTSYSYMVEGSDMSNMSITVSKAGIFQTDPTPISTPSTTLTVTNSSTFSGGYQVGGSSQTIGAFDYTASSTHDVTVSTVGIQVVGSNQPAIHVMNYSLWTNGVLLARTTADTQGYVDFDAYSAMPLSTQVIQAGHTVTLYVTADTTSVRTGVISGNVSLATRITLPQGGSLNAPALYY